MCSAPMTKMLGMEPQILKMFGASVWYQYEFAIGTAVRNVLQGIISVPEACGMAQALYDSFDIQK